MSSCGLQASVRLALTDGLPVLSVSKDIEALLGFTPEDFQTSRVSLRERIHAHDSELANKLFSLDAPHAAGTLHLRLRHADGRIRCVRADYTKTAGHDGQVVLDLLLQDVRSLGSTASSTPAAALFKAMMEGTEDYIYFKDCNHVFTAVSKNLEISASPLGRQIATVGQTAYDFMSEEHADLLYRIDVEVLAGNPVTHQFQHRMLGENLRGWLVNRKYPIRNDAGEIVGLFGIAREISERVWAEESLRENEEELRKSQSIAGLGVFEMNIRTGQMKRSEILDRICGIDKSYPHTREAWLALVHPDDHVIVDSHLTDGAMGQEKTFDRQYRIVRQTDQDLRWVHSYGRLEYDAMGKPARVCGTIQDITGCKQVEVVLGESQRMLQIFVEHAPASLAMFDREMRYLAVSDRYLRENALVGSQIIGRSYYEIFPFIPECWKEAHRRGLAGEELQVNEDRYECSDETQHWVRWQMHPWRAGDGAVGGIVIFSEDITARKQAEESLRLAASVFTHAHEGIMITGADGAILDVNAMFSQITGYTREEVVGRNPHLLNSGRQSKEFYDKLWQSLKESGHWSGEIWNRRKDGRMYAEILTISAVRDDEGILQQYVALFSDITKIKEHESQLEHIAHHDVLTGLPNRVLLADRLNQAIAQSHRRGQQMIVAYLDLDGFKEINDSYGHDAGDQLLATVANRMQAVLREGDTLARMGGDEFVAVLLDLENAQDNLQLLTRLLKAASQPVQVGENELRVTASIGVACYPQSEDAGADLLLRQADQAMYQAKLAGKNRYCSFDFSQDRSTRSRHVDLDRIQQALAAHEFVLYYQPKVNMCKGTVVGAEALIRWQHPERGLMLPGTFLPTIENHPLAVELGEWVIDTALTQMERWKELGLDIPVSVNVGARQLQEPDFVDRLAALLVAHPRVKPSNLELEIVETSVLEEMSQVSQLLDGCREIGVSFALDDFGTGYSSLSYLKHLPADVLKIDQSFVRDILDDPEDLTILEGVLGLASAFRRRFIAEGVETVDQGLMLLRMGCEMAQGFGIARPMPAGDFPQWADTWKPDARWLDVLTASSDERQLIYAAVEHRSWIMAIEGFLKGERHVPPRLSLEQCRFSQWLATEISAGRNESFKFLALEKTHRQIHALAIRIVKYRDREHSPDLLKELEELHRLRDELLTQLEIYKQE